MTNLPLSLAIGDYEHVRDLFTGAVQTQGIDLTALHVPVEELLFRSLRFQEWDLSETGLGAYVAQISQGNRDAIGIPVFPSRQFRHSAFYVRSDAGIARPADLAGKRIGMPEWAMAAAVYARGLLTDRYGIDLRSIRWFQAGLAEAGRRDKTKSNIPAGVEYTPVPDRSLTEMLLAGDLDGIISARAPQPVLDGDPRVKPLFRDLEAEESAYWQDTGILPIMHLVVIRRDTYEKNRWIAMHMLKAFEEAKNRCLKRAMDITCSYFPVPLLSHHLARVNKLAGGDLWPYGVEKNRNTLEGFLRYADEHGVTQRKVAIEELFAPETLAVSRT